ncbi:hypothetical protein [Clostridium sp. CF012]|uniref:hypothetical protein n=1 Tax=Clostridium sp. CF012 TaxID=2843319 RepID=UPI001C0E0520|nr:hypothetical protein [Clostridium sp. CF012]MBU3146913.1 hypothetical protein [Clostridium sp. CF012]
MKKYKLQKLKLNYVKFMLKIYKIIMIMFPKISEKLKLYIEKTSLKRIKEVNKIISNN